MPAATVLAQATGLEQWFPTLIPLGGFGLLLVLLLSYKLIHPRTLEALMAEKDRQIDRAESDRDEWKAAYRASEQARGAEHDARLQAERRADAAVEAAQLVADGLERLRAELEGGVVPRAQRRSQTRSGGS